MSSSCLVPIPPSLFLVLVVLYVKAILIGLVLIPQDTSIQGIGGPISLHTSYTKVLGECKDALQLSLGSVLGPAEWVPGEALRM